MKMPIPRRLLALGLIWLLLFACAAAWWTFERREVVRENERRREWAVWRERLDRIEPPLDDAGDKAIQHRIAHAEASLANRSPEVQAQPPAATDPIDAWIELDRAKARLRERATTLDVSLHDEHVRQIVDPIIADLARTLVEARPREILAFERRPTEPPTGPTDGTRAAGMQVRVGFVGQTRTLRELLTALADPESALVVRGVEVQPAGAGASRGMAPTDAKRPADSVGEAWSRFSVEVTVDPSRAIVGPSMSETAWPEPVRAADAGAWVFQLFTPPVIRRDAASGGFQIDSFQRVTPPVAAPGIRLLAVRREPYRLQVEAIFGAPGEWIAVVSGPAADTQVARPGQRFESLGLSLLRFAEDDSAAEGASDARVAIFADDHTGAEMALRLGTRPYEPAMSAVLQVQAGESDREVWLGDAVETANGLYRVARILAEPAEVVLVRETRHPSDAEVLVLRLDAGTEGPRGPALAKAATTAGPTD